MREEDFTTEGLTEVTDQHQGMRHQGIRKDNHMTECLREDQPQEVVETQARTGPSHTETQKMVVIVKTATVGNLDLLKKATVGNLDLDLDLVLISDYDRDLEN